MVIKYKSDDVASDKRLSVTPHFLLPAASVRFAGLVSFCCCVFTIWVVLVIFVFGAVEQRQMSEIAEESDDTNISDLAFLVSASKNKSLLLILDSINELLRLIIIYIRSTMDRTHDFNLLAQNNIELKAELICFFCLKWLDGDTLCSLVCGNLVAPTRPQNRNKMGI